MGTGIIEDPPNPDLDTLLQREDFGPALPVRHDGPVTVHQLPARSGPIIKTALTTDFQHILGADEKRKRVVLVCDVDWELSRSGATGSGCPWYAKVPLAIEHCDKISARVPTSTGTLTAVTEIWAD